MHIFSLNYISVIRFFYKRQFLYGINDDRLREVSLYSFNTKLVVLNNDTMFTLNILFTLKF